MKERNNTSIELDNHGDEWFTLDSIDLLDNNESVDKLYCISVDAPEKQFLIGEMGVPTHNTDEAKAADELKGESTMIIGSIARLGRGAKLFFETLLRGDKTFVS